MARSRIDCLKILGLSDTATEDEIKKAYRQKALELHPDKNQNDPQATERFQHLKEAYETLVEEEDEELVFIPWEIVQMFRIFAMQSRFGFPHEEQRFDCPHSTDRQQPRHSYRNYFDDEFDRRHNSRNFGTTRIRKENSETMSTEESDDDDWLDGLIPTGNAQQYGTKQKQSSKKKKGKQKKKNSNTRKWTKVNGNKSYKETFDKESSVAEEISENEREIADDDVPRKSSINGQVHNETKDELPSQKTNENSAKTSTKFANHVPENVEQNIKTSREFKNKKEHVHNDDTSNKSQTKKKLETKHENAHVQEQPQADFVKTQQTPNIDTNVKKEHPAPNTGVNTTAKSTPFIETSQKQRNTNNTTDKYEQHNGKFARKEAKKVNSSSTANSPRIACTFQNANNGTTSSNSKSTKSDSKQINDAGLKKKMPGQTRTQQNIESPDMLSQQNTQINRDKTGQRDQTKKIKPATKGCQQADNSFKINETAWKDRNTEKSGVISPKTTSKEDDIRHPSHINSVKSPHHAQTDKSTKLKRNSTANSFLSSKMMQDVSSDVTSTGDHSSAIKHDNVKQRGKKLPSTNDDTLQKDQIQLNDGVMREWPDNSRTPKNGVSPVQIQNNKQQFDIKLPKTNVEKTTQNDKQQPKDCVKQKRQHNLWTQRSDASSHEQYKDASVYPSVTHNVKNAHDQQGAVGQEKGRQNFQKSFKANCKMGGDVRPNIYSGTAVNGTQHVQFAAAKEQTTYVHPMYFPSCTTTPVQEQMPFGGTPITQLFQEGHEYHTKPVDKMELPSFWGDSTGAAPFQEKVDDTGHVKKMYQEESVSHSKQQAMPGRANSVWTKPPVQKVANPWNRSRHVQEEPKRHRTTTSAHKTFANPRNVQEEINTHTNSVMSDIDWPTLSPQENFGSVKDTSRNSHKGINGHSEWLSPSVLENLYDVRNAIRSFQEGFKSHTRPVMNDHAWVFPADQENDANVRNTTKESTANARTVTTEYDWSYTSAYDQATTSRDDFIVYYPCKPEYSVKTQCGDYQSYSASTNPTLTPEQHYTEEQELRHKSTSSDSSNGENIESSKSVGEKGRKPNSNQSKKKQKRPPRSAGFLITLE